MRNNIMLSYAEPYISLLTKYPDFNLSNIDVSGDVIIKYSLENDINLIKLRKKYDIDNKVSGKNTLDKVISLTDWVHYKLFFAGDNVYPEQCNSLSILSINKQGALFCFYQSIVLNDVLLSLGIKSRIIKCLPCEFDMDCHVGVISFVPEMKKWIFFDPTFNTYFTDQQGNPLSITEVRETYKNAQIPLFKPILINKNWTLVLNGIEYETYDDWYSVYMAKNCFRFSSLIESSFDYNSKEYERNIFLNPIGYRIKNEYDNSIKNPNLSLYTNNVSCFFRSPEY
jgi:hypothetical protein